MRVAVDGLCRSCGGSNVRRSLFCCRACLESWRDEQLRLLTGRGRVRQFVLEGFSVCPGVVGSVQVSSSGGVRVHLSGVKR